MTEDHIDIRLTSKKKSQNNSIKISIITPVLNGVNTIEKCILSVLEQDFADVEHIIVDGGSVDGTLEILKSYQEALLIVKQKGGGKIYGAINEGLKIAKGDWILVLGSDDYLISGALEKSLGHLKNTSEAYYGNVIKSSTGYFYDGKFSIRKIMYKNICHQSIFYPSSYCGNNEYNEDYHILSDHEYLMRYIKNNEINYIPLNIAHYNDKSGISSLEIDNYFYKQKLKLIKDNFNFHYYIEFLLRHNFVKIIRMCYLEKFIKKLLNKI